MNCPALSGHVKYERNKLATFFCPSSSSSLLSHSGPLHDPSRPEEKPQSMIHRRRRWDSFTRERSGARGRAVRSPWWSPRGCLRAGPPASPLASRAGGRRRVLFCPRTLRLSLPVPHAQTMLSPSTSPLAQIPASGTALALRARNSII